MIKEYYPTPDNLILEMIKDLDMYQIDTILEPSAGEGYIGDCLLKNWKSHKPKIDCIEIDDKLRAILKSKDYNVIYDNFLRFNTEKKYDLIIMNPPFSNGDAHLLKAIELQKNGGEIICILNAETLKNPHSNKRKALLRGLEELSAKVEFIESAFSHSERKTDVEIALIKINIPNRFEGSSIANDLKKSMIDYGDFEEKNEIDSKANPYEFLERAYTIDAKLGVAFINEYFQLLPKLMRDFDEKFSRPIISLNVNIKDDKDFTVDTRGGRKKAINEFINQLRLKYWEKFFDESEIGNMMTNNLRKEYSSQINKLKDYDFNLFNMYSLRVEIDEKMEKSVESTIIDLFDELSSRHSYNEFSKNIHLFDGWKTNKAYYINKKVIIPLSAYSQWYPDDFRPKSHDVVRKLKDIEKVFNYLDLGRTRETDIGGILKEAEETVTTKNIECKFFNLTFFKKGTCHIVFKDDELLKKFNIFGAQHKKWLPPSYSKKAYKDLSPEEKAVIKSFESPEEYEKVCNDTEFYIHKNVFMLADNQKLLA